MLNDYQREWVWHIIFWVSYLLFKIYHEFIWIYPKYEDININTVLAEATIAQSTMLPVKIIFTYWLIYYLLPVRKFIVHKWVLFIFALALTLLIYRLMVVYITLPLAYTAIPDQQSVLSLERMTSAIIDILFVAGLASAIILYQRNQQNKKQTTILEKEKVASELRFLKHQTNPHFLLNTLNNLYVLARKNAAETPAAIMQLSKLMKFVLYESSSAYIPMKKEVEVIHDYIALQRLRFGNRLDISIDVQDNPDDQPIAPLLLLPLVENAFKHGAGESTTIPFIKIKLEIINGIINFTIKNNVEGKEKSIEEGVGFTNLKRQLTLLYPNHKFTVSQSDNYFTVHLQLPVAHEEDLLPDNRR